MKVTLYEALGIQPTASDAQVRASLRSLVRQYYLNTRDDQNEIEEALRFVNHASHILTDKTLRQRYDEEIASGIHIGSDAARKHFVANMAALGLGRSVTFGTAGVEGDFSNPQQQQQKAHHQGLTAALPRVARGPFYQIAAALVLLPLLAIVIWLVTPWGDLLQNARLMLIWATGGLLVAAGVFSLTTSIAQRRRRTSEPFTSAVAQVTILKWRKEKTVFMGTFEPMEDPTWLFRLRMVELERAQNQRTSGARPWVRFAARMFDYGLWGVSLTALLYGLGVGAVIDPSLIALLTHPIIAPLVTTATWIPVETVLQVYLHTTPGKWLFSVYVQFGVSSAHTRPELRRRWLASLRRAVRVWWQGMGCGVPVLSLAFMALGKEALMNQYETDWDAKEDCLVTHGPVGAGNAATGFAGLLAYAWITGISWAAPMQATAAEVEAWTTDLIENVATAVDRMKPGDNVPIQVAANAVADETPSPLDIKKKRWADWATEAEQLGAAKNFQGQMELCQKWSEEDFRNPAAWRCLGLSRQALGQHKLAVEALQRAARYDPNDRVVQDAIVRSFRAQYGR
jgi:hypothetical protein